MERVIRWTFASATLAQAAKMSLSRSAIAVIMAAPANTVLARSAVAVQRCASLFSEGRFPCANWRRHTVGCAVMRRRRIAAFCRDDGPQIGPMICLLATLRHSGLAKVSVTESHGSARRESLKFILSHSATPRCVHGLA